MKKIWFTLVVLASLSFANAAPVVSEKVLNAFNRVFPGAENTRWYESENNYEAYFENGDIKCRVRFDKQGKVVGTIRYYGEKELSPFIKAKLAQKFPGKTVFGITETASEDELAYNIVLEDNNTWTHVKADGGGQLEVTEKFKKAGQ